MSSDSDTVVFYCAITEALTGEKKPTNYYSFQSGLRCDNAFLRFDAGRFCTVFEHPLHGEALMGMLEIMAADPEAAGRLLAVLKMKRQRQGTA